MVQSTVAAKRALKITHTYAAPPEKVFRAWTDPEVMKRWFAPSDEFSVPEVAVDPPRKLVFTWAWESTPERESLVTVEFNAAGVGTELVLIHERIADEEAHDKHEQGWNGCLNRLPQALAV